MSKQQIMYRLLSSELGIEFNRLHAARLVPNEWTFLGQGINQLSEMPLFLEDRVRTVEGIRALLPELVESQGGSLGLVIVDYLQLFADAVFGNRAQDLGFVVRGLKQIARDFEVPVLCASQLNRGPDFRTNKRPMLSDLRDSGTIAEDSDMVLSLYREEYYDPDTPDRGIAEIIVTKHRNGPTGTVKLLFEPQYTRFRNLAQPQQQDTPHA